MIFVKYREDSILFSDAKEAVLDLLLRQPDVRIAVVDDPSKEIP